MYTSYSNQRIPMSTNRYQSFPTQSQPSQDRIGGFLFPFVLGGITGGLLSPAFRPNYYPAPYPYPYYQPYPYYNNYYYYR